MRILFLSPDCLPGSVGGVEVYAHELARELVRRGHSAGILSAVSQQGVRPYTVRRFEYDGIAIISVAHRMVGSIWRRLQLLGGLAPAYVNRRLHDLIVRLIDESRPDVVHVHHLAHLSAGIIESLKRRGIPVVLTLHDYWFLCANGQLLSEDLEPHMPESCDYRCLTYLITKACLGAAEVGRSGGIGPSPRQAIAARLLRGYVNLRSGFFTAAVRRKREALLAEIENADRILAPSRFLRDVYVRAGLPGETISYCDHGVDAGRLLELRSRAPPRRPIRFAYIGRLVPEKGLHVLARAFTFSPDEASLDIYGAVAERFPYYRDYVRSQVPAGSRVVFHEPVPRERLAAAYRDIDVVVCPSICWENSPLSIQEAFLAGAPVVTADIGGMRELVTNGTNGLLFRFGDSTDLGRKLRLIVDDPSLISRLRPDPARVKTMVAHAGELETVYATVADGS